jgi:hypothetical protein
MKRFTFHVFNVIYLIYRSGRKGERGWFSSSRMRGVGVDMLVLGCIGGSDGFCDIYRIDIFMKVYIPPGNPLEGALPGDLGVVDGR